jgi:malate synthase
MRGDLTESFEKGGKILHRELAADRKWTALDGGDLTLAGAACCSSAMSAI